MKQLCGKYRSGAADVAPNNFCKSVFVSRRSHFLQIFQEVTQKKIIRKGFLSVPAD
jgi:hypothetical protein